ncbi:polysaccharide deacetylase family protein [Paenarthrobacter sp. NPDC018779]|uniref:polysaccharide deacetylase family protein n=1 Tax=Paenarthrobacter sp. NPDC018779 TaxID=3364375 RepID=UPI0037C96CDD
MNHPVRRELLRQALLARKGGRIGTGGRGAVALRFDDGARDFRDKVLPLLVERSLPFTRVTTTQRIGTVPTESDTWQNIQHYCLQHGGEVWNHGATHKDASGDDALHQEIVGALRDLRRFLPRLPIDCFAPPGGSSIRYDGHMPSRTVAAWAGTFAGRLINDFHALASGYFPDSYYRPLDGVLRDGQNHYSLDLYTETARATALVDRAREWRTGIVMMWHANNLGVKDRQSMEAFTAILDYLVEQRDQGSLLVLTASGLGTADASSTHRDNILVTGSGNPFAESIPYPQYRQNIPGSTRELTATVSAPAGTAVESVIGESARHHVVPVGGTLYLRHLATVPLDVKSLDITINAASRDVRLVPV